MDSTDNRKKPIYDRSRISPRPAIQAPTPEPPKPDPDEWWHRAAASGRDLDITSLSGMTYRGKLLTVWKFFVLMGRVDGPQYLISKAAVECACYTSDAAEIRLRTSKGNA